ncbi:hypothetical protein IW150_005884, partial [Coemansia sp. RSA 2607]
TPRDGGARSRGSCSAGQCQAHEQQGEPGQHTQAQFAFVQSQQRSDTIHSGAEQSHVLPGRRGIL